ncbi:MAG TPA: PsbP-related protein [Candidatus Saccharimonadales bacterium]
MNPENNNQDPAPNNPEVPQTVAPETQAQPANPVYNEFNTPAPGQQPIEQPSLPNSPSEQAPKSANKTLIKVICAGLILLVLAAIIGLLFFVASGAKNSQKNKSSNSSQSSTPPIVRNYSSQSGAFSVYFPQKPTETAPKTIVIPGTTISSSGSVWVSGDTSKPPVYSVTVFSLPSGADININSIYNSQLTDFKAIGTVNVESTKNTSVGGHPAILSSYSVSIKTQTLYVSSLVMTANNKLYLVSSISTTQNEAAATKFVDSFLPS